MNQVTVSVDLWMSIATIIAAFLAPTVATIIGIKISSSAASKAAKAVVRVEQKIEETTATTTATMDANASKLDKIHSLVNSRLTEALKKIDMLEKRLYKLTGEQPTGEPPPKHQA